MRQPPSFSGNIEDWQRLEREWRDYEVLMRQCFPTLDDRTLLGYLKPCLDSASQTNMQRQLEEHPNPKFSDF